MLRDLNKDQAQFIALLAHTARIQRDKLLGNVAEGDLAGENAARGEHNPTALLGFAPLSPNSEQMVALREAIDALTPAARAELYTLMRIGQGDLAARMWHHGLNEAALLGDSTAAVFLDDPDLHDHLAKGIYEVERR